MGSKPSRNARPGYMIVKSIRTKTALLTVCAIIVTTVVATLLGVVAIRNIGNTNSNEMLLLLCETGEKELDSYFEGVERSVEMVSAYAEQDLEGMGSDSLENHLDRVEEIFAKMTTETNGILTYYYRIDPSASDTAKGFWFVNLDGEGFQEHEVTDITLYDTKDTSSLVWFTVPKSTGKPVWLPPYITDNLDVRVLSYNVPIYRGSQFIGVIGIEIDYSTMAREVDNITLYEDGYAFINDAEGTIIYHPRMDVTTMETQPKVPDGLLSDDKFITYTFEGVQRQAVWLPLSNGMRLNVTVPVSEINGDWQRWVNQIIVVSLALLVIFILITMRFTGRITKPLRELAEVAEQVNKGNYDCKLDYTGNDEVGILTSAFNRLISHMKDYISDLNDLAYADALTSVHNKGAFDIYVQKLQAQLDEQNGKLEFAICIFDCNSLKAVNDAYGHEKGDAYLKSACSIICHVFDHSPVFRVGGDEFAAILQNADYHNRDELLQAFDDACAATRERAGAKWDQVDIARGIAVYDPQEDGTVNDVVRRADRLMYQNKWESKGASSD